MKNLQHKRVYFMMENPAGHCRLLFTYPELAAETFANKVQVRRHPVHGSDGIYTIPVYRNRVATDKQPG